MKNTTNARTKPQVFPCGPAGEESARNVRDLGSAPARGRSPGEGNATHSSILAWRFHGLYSPGGSKESDTTEQLSLLGFTLILPVFPLMSFFFFPVPGSNTESFWNRSSSQFTWGPSRTHLQMSVFSVQSLFASPCISTETATTMLHAPCLVSLSS